jgi:hypothetical protein
MLQKPKTILANALPIFPSYDPYLSYHVNQNPEVPLMEFISFSIIYALWCFTI